MRKIIFAFLALVVLGIGMAMASSSLCPFNPEGEPEGVPSGTTIQALTVGSINGYSMINQENVWQVSGNQTGIQSNSFSALSGQGTLNIMSDTKLSTKLYGITSTTARAIEYQGTGIAFDDSFLSLSISNGAESESSCESAIGGARAMFSSGAYGSQTLGMISPGNGMTITQEIGTGEVSPVRPTGMVGVFTVYGASGQDYGDMSQSFSTSATFGGVSTVAHSFKFDTMTE